MKRDRKFVQLGKKVGRLVVSMLVVSVVLVGVLYVSRFYTLTDQAVQDKCVICTNLASAELAGQDAGALGEDTWARLQQLKGQTGCEFVVFSGQKAAGSTLDGSPSGFPLDSAVPSERSWTGTVKLNGVPYVGSAVPVSGGVLFAGVTTDSAFRQLKLVIYVVMGISLLLVALDVGWIAVYTRKNISRPLAGLEALASSMKEGDLGIRSGVRPASGVRSNDEIGYLAEVMEGTMGRMADYIGEIDRVLRAIAQGDLTGGVRQDYVGDFVSIRQSLEHILERLEDTMAQLSSSSDQVSAGSDQVARGAQALSQGASEQSASVGELESTFREVSQRIESTAADAADASRDAARMGQDITESNRKMEALTAAMGEIKRSSDEIGKIIKTIEDIAFQTNILALNASVEASRAGSAGKGFAVVANEVRSLAGKSAEASQSTSGLIHRSAAAVERGTALAAEAERELKAVAAGADQVVEVIHRIAADAEAQAGAVVQVKEQVQQISSVVQANSATAEESSAASEELSNQALLLRQLMQRFRLRDRAGR